MYLFACIVNSNTLCHYTVAYELKLKLLTSEKVIKEFYKLKMSETEYLRMKAGTDSTDIICLYYHMTGREEALVKNKKEIELLQERISLTSIQLLMEQKASLPSM